MAEMDIELVNASLRSKPSTFFLRGSIAADRVGGPIRTPFPHKSRPANQAQSMCGVGDWSFCESGLKNDVDPET
jgi:hypothetical protein